MTYDPAFDDLMPDTITVQHVIGRNAYGEANAESAPAALRARVLFTPKRITTATGEEKVSSATVWVSGTTSSNITVNDVVTLPDGTTPPLLRMDIVPDEDGEHHRVLYF